MYQKNLKAIEKFHPYLLDFFNGESYTDFKVFYRNGHLKIDKFTCFSKYNPEDEANRAVENWEKDNKVVKNIVVFGFSNPFIITKLLKKYNVSVFIPDINLFKEFLKVIDFSNIIEKVERFIVDISEVDKDYNIFSLQVEKRLFGDILKKIINSNKNYIKVLLVNPIYGGSLPISNYIAKNLGKFNVKLNVFNSENFFNVMNYIKNKFSIKRLKSHSLDSLVNFISDLIINTIEESNPDILFGVAQSPINFKVLNYCKEKEILKIFWFMEDYKLFTYWKQFAPFYDYYFTIQKDQFFNELKNIGVKNYYYLPVAAEPSIHKPLKLTEEEKKYYGSTISFVGAGYYNRRKFFRILLDYDFKIWGSDWEGEIILKDKIQENGRRVSPEEYVKIFNASLINVNLHSSTYLPGIDPEGDFVNPRAFEIAATNSIQLVDRRKYLPELFNENEIIVFSDESEFKNLIDDIIKNPKKYKEIAQNGYRRVLKEHTYRHRLKEMFNLIGFKLEKIEFKEESADYYFFKYNSLEEMVEHINKKDKINDDEKIILLMNALKETYLK